MIKIRVPASSANIGPGFDCIGIALEWYNYIEAEQIEKGLIIEVEQSDDECQVSTDEKNLVYRSMQRVFETAGWHPSGLRIRLTNNVPLSKGLGSSAMCIAGGMYAANCMLPEPYSMDTIINMASRAEGHPDNTTPCLVGGLCIAVEDNGTVYYISHPLPQNLSIALIIPSFTVSTKQARRKLPSQIARSDGIYNIGHTALLVASLITGKYENLTFATKDRLHQFYRSNMVPNMYQIFEKCLANGARGVYLSGAGPAIAAIIDGDRSQFKEKMKQALPGKGRDWQVEIVSVNNTGTTMAN